MRRLAAAVFLVLTILAYAGACACRAEEPWRGVDEAVVEKFAQEHGRPAKGCPLSIEGDALLFAFLAGGAIGGFAMGYFYREFTAPGGRTAGKEGKGRDAD